MCNQPTTNMVRKVVELKGFKLYSELGDKCESWLGLIVFLQREVKNIFIYIVATVYFIQSNFIQKKTKKVYENTGFELG